MLLDGRQRAKDSGQAHQFGRFSAAPEARDQLSQIGWKGRLKSQGTPIHWVTHAQAMRVQRLPGKIDETQAVRPIHVTLLPHQGVAAQPRLQTDLIPLAGHEPDLDERGVFERLDHSILAPRVFAPRITRMRRLLDERTLIPHEVIAPRAGQR